MRVLLVIMSCVKNEFLWKKILEKNKDCIIFCGKKIDKPYILKDRILYLNCRDTYECLPEKVVCMIDAILKIPEFSDVTHIFKIDDHDTEIPPNLSVLVDQNILKTNDYLGQKVQNHPGNNKYHIGKCSKDSKWNTTPYSGNYVAWALGGYGYILSRKAMAIINNKYKPKDSAAIYVSHIGEDVMIALTLHDSKIYPVQIKECFKANLPPIKK